MRYPTDKRGLAYPVADLGYENPEYTHKRTSNHHLYWERRRYVGNEITRVFRSLAPHVQTMWIPEHQELHEDFTAPKMPARKVMVNVLDDYAEQHGELHIVREQCTNEIYTMTKESWRLLRDGTKAY